MEGPCWGNSHGVWEETGGTGTGGRELPGLQPVARRPFLLQLSPDLCGAKVGRV